MGYKEDACAAVIEGLEAIGIEFFIHIPDSFGAPVIAHFENQPEVRTFPVAREEEGIGIASGLAMTGKKGVLFCQDVGLGNSMVALTTFVTAYHVPILVLAIRRGGFWEFNAPPHNHSQHPVGLAVVLKKKNPVLCYP